MSDTCEPRAKLRLVASQEQPNLTQEAGVDFGVSFEIDSALLEAVSKNVVVFPPQDVGALPATEVTPAECLRLALKDALADPTITKCYLTLFRDDEEDTVGVSYRAGLTKEQEVAYRHLGASVALDNWKSGD